MKPGQTRAVQARPSPRRPGTRRSPLCPPCPCSRGSGFALWPVFLLAGALLAGCQPKVRVEAPKEPITINLNVKIEHEVRVKVDRELDELFEDNPELF